MQFRTIVDIPQSEWQIEPCERMLFVGSCFADNIGKRFVDEKFRAIVNPYGVMYNPASIYHTVQRLINGDKEGFERLGDKPSDAVIPFKKDEQGTAVFTLGTNHVYVLKETSEIVDNCSKRPQSIFQEKELTVDECADYLSKTIDLIHSHYPLVRFIFTVSPIRYRKYGYHGSQLSKATLLLAIQRINNLELKVNNSNFNAQSSKPIAQCAYFPSYEIMNDELRDYRFYKPDMLHPSDQAVEYIYDRMAETYFSPSTFEFLKEWKPIREALNHKPFHPESDAYKTFMSKTQEKLNKLREKYPI